MEIKQEPQSTNTLNFDPNQHANATLKAFNNFITRFELRYSALYPDPPKVSIDAAIARWKIENATEENADPKPNVQQYDTIKAAWQSKDKVSKLLGMFSTERLYEDWLMAAEVHVQVEAERTNPTWNTFLQAMRTFYAPTENRVLKNYRFRDIRQSQNQSFISFCNEVEREAKHCHFKCTNDNCDADKHQIVTQIVTGTHYEKIREEALLKSWDLNTLRSEGMKIESATQGGVEMSNDQSVYRAGKYSNKNTRKLPPPPTPKPDTNCYNCGNLIQGTITGHRRNCTAKKHKCTNCGKIGHFETVCFRKKKVKRVTTEGNESDGSDEDKRDASNEGEENYYIKLFRIKKPSVVKPHFVSALEKKNDFKAEVVVNNSLAKVVADTGARVSVCGSVQAKQWGLLSKMIPSQAKILPYRSDPIPVLGTATVSVSFGETSVPVKWYIISGSSEPVLSGKHSENLGIITFHGKPDILHPLNMISKSLNNNTKETLQQVIAKYPQNFTGLGKLKDYQVKFHVDNTVKPVAASARPTPYHLRERINKQVQNMLTDDIIEEHPINEPAPWVSNPVFRSKPDSGEIRFTIDAKHVNKAIISSNLPIPRQEDIRTQLAGNKVFSKLDFKSAFWQLELHPDSRYLTVFNMDGKLYRKKRLAMGFKPSQGELNTALKPIFAHIPHAHLIHDDLILATKTENEHVQVVQAVMEAIAHAGLTLNPEKCEFGKEQIKFWGMIISGEGVYPDPEKVDALNFIEAPKSKPELISFLCMLQSNAEFIENFAMKSAPLRELTKGSKKFVWENKHEQCFQYLLKEFKKDTLLRYYEMDKPTYIFVDGHSTGLGAILAQGDSAETAKPIAFTSRTTTDPESRYPQLDLEAMAVDFGLRRFRQYIAGAPDKIKVVTDHKPLCSIFNGSRQGSIRTERIKMRHQDVRFHVYYQKGKKNQSDCISRNAKHLSTLSEAEQSEAEDLHNLLYMLHATPVIDHLTLERIARETELDPILSQLQTMIRDGKTWIPKDSDPALKRFKPILQELMIAGNGILFKGERIILPHKLQGEAVALAHQGSHPRHSSMLARLRCQFFFHNMDRLVDEYLHNCKDCKLFTDKKTMENIQPHAVPDKCWQKVAVDLFGPMPSSDHVVIVQDLASRYPTGKIVRSTKASDVIPALREVYDQLGNPEVQLSDNGPPFTSKAMNDFTRRRHIEPQYIPPHHPSANPVEQFMRSVGKTMKIAHHNNTPENVALAQLLSNYRNTPHPVTKIPPSAMLFRDASRSSLPWGKRVSNEMVDAARSADIEEKFMREQSINASKFRVQSDFRPGDRVLIRNQKRTSKFMPYFGPDEYVITEIRDNGTRLLINRCSDGQELQRHPDDVKICSDLEPLAPVPQTISPNNWSVPHYGDPDNDGEGIQFSNMNPHDIPEQQLHTVDNPPPRRTGRHRTPNTRYYNDEMVN